MLGGNAVLWGHPTKLHYSQIKMSDWPVQMIDLTNDGNYDVVLTISGSAIASLTPDGNENLVNE